MNKFEKPFVFYRKTNLLKFTRSKESSEHAHIFYPWSRNIGEDLLYKLKKSILDFGGSCIPTSFISPADQNIIKGQIEKGQETHLVMSNMESIHILRVKGLRDAESKALNTLPEFSELAFDCELWIEVDDLFVARAGHEFGHEIIEQLNSILEGPQRENLFYNWRGLNEKQTFENTPRWVDQKRSLTKDYAFKELYFSKYIFNNQWGELHRESQHETILAGLSLDKFNQERGTEGFCHLADSVERYYSAVKNELYQIYILPLVSELRKKGSLFNEWDKLSRREESRSNQMIQELVDCESFTLNNLQDALDFLLEAKSFIFDLELRISRLPSSVETIYVEGLLKKSRSIMGSFSTKKLDQDIQILLRLYEWTKEVRVGVETLSFSEVTHFSISLSLLVDKILGQRKEENILLLLCSEKNSLHQKSTLSFSKSLDSLLSEGHGALLPSLSNKKVRKAK